MSVTNYNNIPVYWIEEMSFSPYKVKYPDAYMERPGANLSYWPIPCFLLKIVISSPSLRIMITLKAKSTHLLSPAVLKLKRSFCQRGFAHSRPVLSFYTLIKYRKARRFFKFWGHIEWEHCSYDWVKTLVCFGHNPVFEKCF